MVDWEYWRVCIVVLTVQLVALYISSMVIGLVVYVCVVVGSYVLVLFDIDVVRVNLRWIVVNFRWVVINWSKYIAILAWIVALLDVVFDEIIAFMHSFDAPKAIGWISGFWEVVAVIRLSNDPNQFRDVIVCDRIESNDDPFGPDHTSFVHFVEIRRHNFAWKEIIVWRVSMLSGAQTSVARKQFVAFDSPFNRRFVANRFECFESRGVVFAFVNVPFFRQRRKKLLFVFDTNANGKSGQFELPDYVIRKDFLSISCLQRIIRPNSEVSGWQIRLLAVSHRWVNHGNVEFYLAKYETELREGDSGPTNFDVSVMTVGSFVGCSYTFVRTSDGMFGVSVRGVVNGGTRVLLYDPACNVYVYCADLQELRKLDKPFASYIERRAAFISANFHPATLALMFSDFQPTVLTDRECILRFNGTRFLRMEIKPATLLYASAKRIFRADPSLKSRMNAAEFRNLSGMDRMSANFEP